MSPYTVAGVLPMQLQYLSRDHGFDVQGTRQFSVWSRTANAVEDWNVEAKATKFSSPGLDSRTKPRSLLRAHAAMNNTNRSWNTRSMDLWVSCRSITRCEMPFCWWRDVNLMLVKWICYEFDPLKLNLRRKVQLQRVNQSACTCRYRHGWIPMFCWNEIFLTNNKLNSHCVGLYFILSHSEINFCYFIS